MSTTLARPPPVPRRRSFLPTTSNDDEEKVNGLAACVAAMSTGANSPRPARPPPVPPRASSGNVTSNDATPDLARLLARRPPPPPTMSRRSSSSYSTSPQPPALPLRASPSPSLPPRAPSIPPALNTSSKPVSIPTRLAPPPPPPSPPPVAEEEEVESCLQCRNFDEVDAHAAQFPRESVSSLEDLAHWLTDPFEDDAEKARAIFTWLHYNIAYDAESFLSGNLQASTPESTLSSGLAVCEGYAKLFENLADFVGLQAHTVTGHGKGYGYKPLRDGEPLPEMSSNHAWNCVLIGEEWRLIDSCWGSGSLQGTTYVQKLANRWFVADPIEFGQRHFPEDPSFQLTAEEVSWEEYILAPEGPTITADFTDLGLHPNHISPPGKFVPEKVWMQFTVSKKCEHMSTAEEDNYIYIISSNGKDFTPLEFSEEEQAWSVTIFTPRNGDITLYSVDTVGSENAYGLGMAGYTKAKGRKAMGFKGLAVWTVAYL